MGNANGKFNATTVSLYNALTSYSSARTNHRRLQLRTNRDTSSDGLSHMRSPTTDLPSTPAPNLTAMRLQFTPYADTLKLATPSPDRSQKSNILQEETRCFIGNYRVQA
eukprot:scaffold11749_cov55-Attheya_sp.AAC.2